MSTPPRQSSIKTRPGSAWRMASAPAELQDDHRVVQEPLKERALDRALADHEPLHGSRLDARLTMPPERWPSHAVIGTARPLGVTSP